MLRHMFECKPGFLSRYATEKLHRIGPKERLGMESLSEVYGQICELALIAQCKAESHVKNSVGVIFDSFISQGHPSPTSPGHLPDFGSQMCGSWSWNTTRRLFDHIALSFPWCVCFACRRATLQWVRPRFPRPEDQEHKAPETGRGILCIPRSFVG